MTDDFEWSDEAVQAFCTKFWTDPKNDPDLYLDVRRALKAAAKAQGIFTPQPRKIVQLVFAPDGPVNHAGLYALWSDGTVSSCKLTDRDWVEHPELRNLP